MGAAAERLRDLIARHGPIGFDTFVEVALYDPEGGFYATTGQAGRRGDFLTSPEVGPLFGAVVARALDGWWDELGNPDPYVVADCGAGPGTLARTVLAASPRCGPALRYVLVERSAAQRAHHAAGLPLVPPTEAFLPGVEDPDVGPAPGPAPRGPLCVSLPELPAATFTGVILANELLDNLPFGLLVFDGGWREARVGVAGDGRFVELLVPPSAPLPRRLPERPAHAARAPTHHAAAAWLADALAHLQAGTVCIFDYASATDALAARPWREWLRTYRGHQRGVHPLRDAGEQDITTEVALDQLGHEPDGVRTQAEWLRRHGIEELVEEGRRVWAERGAIGDLAALRARSRVREAEALLDPAGLGAFTVAEWRA